MIRDDHGRPVRYLRLSLTQSCPMRCIYCRPADLPPPATDQPLTPEELEAVVRHLVLRHGLTKVRLTGGEPADRPDLIEIVERLSRIEGLQDLAMTTAGLTLVDQAAALKKAGLGRVNVSLDSLCPQTFRRITGGRHDVQTVRAGIQAACLAGLGPVKLNTVVLRGLNDRELPDLVAFAARNDLEIRFIELMPMGPLAGRWERLHVPEAQIRRLLSPMIRRWAASPEPTGAAQRHRVTLATGQTAIIGFISPMSRPFCRSCSRMRLTADGLLYPCLMGPPAGGLLPALRPVLDAESLDDLLRQTMLCKPAEHAAAAPGVMTCIGG